jgi:type II secretory pathway pseudopilin PulG
MSPRRPQSSHARGFTLIEILVIVALIAMLSGIAVFQVKSVMDQTRIKATYPDLRSVADALTTAHFDLGFFPKLGFLSLSQPQLIQNNTLPEDFEVMGFGTTQAIGPQRMAQIVDAWNGPYFNAAGGRSPLKTGTRGYYVQMQMPRATSATPLVDWPAGTLVEWPADPWGSPYVVYLLHQDKAVLDPSDPTKTTYLKPPPPRFVRSPYEEPNYFAAVVSYGPNGIPGGSADPHFGNNPSVIATGRQFRLFTSVPAASSSPTRFVALKDNEVQVTTPVSSGDVATSRILSLSMNDPFGYLGAFRGPDNSQVPGILDPTFTYMNGSTKVTVMGSDDIVVPIR